MDRVDSVPLVNVCVSLPLPSQRPGVSRGPL